MPPLLAELNYIYAGIYNIIIITTEELHNRSYRFYNLYKHILTMTRHAHGLLLTTALIKKSIAKRIVSFQPVLICCYYTNMLTITQHLLMPVPNFNN